MHKQAVQVKTILENLYQKYNHVEFIPPNPLQWVYRYKKNTDREIVAFIAAALAYGRVEQINKSLEKLFAVMGQSPADFVSDFKQRGHVLLLRDLSIASIPARTSPICLCF